MSMLPFEQKLTFQLPNEYKNDIIYCQRALRTHLKVHKIFIEKYYKNLRTSCRIYLETQINEISCEQELLLVAVHVINHDFFMALSSEYIGVNHFTINHYISQQVLPFIENENYAVVPIHIRERLTEQQLLERFCTAEKGENTTISPSPSIAMALEPPPPRVDFSEPLLNAMSERTVTRSVPEPTIPDEEILQASPAMPTVLPVAVTPVRASVIVAAKCDTKPISKVVNKSPPPKTVSTEAAKAHLPVVAAAGTPVRVSIIMAPKSDTKPVSKVVKRTPPPKRVSVEADKAYLPVVAAASKPVPVAVHAAPKSNTKPVSKAAKKAPPPKRVSKSDPKSPPQLDTKTKPDDYDQETFLGLFGLCTKDQIQLMQQRRSKRQRRTVYNNEKSDFYYEPIDDMESSPTNAKKRKRESRPSEVDRSQSSSPDDKALCK